MSTTISISLILFLCYSGWCGNTSHTLVRSGKGLQCASNGLVGPLTRRPIQLLFQVGKVMVTSPLVVQGLSLSPQCSAVQCSAVQCSVKRAKMLLMLYRLGYSPPLNIILVFTSKKNYSNTT